MSSMIGNVSMMVMRDQKTAYSLSNSVDTRSKIDLCSDFIDDYDRRIVANRVLLEIFSPFLNSTTAIFPSRIEAARKYEESALVALIPTPFIPIACLKTELLYLAPVFTLETQSSSLPSGIPRP